MQKGDQIFLNQPQPDYQKTPQQIKYIHNTESADYITQFLLDEGSHDLFKDKHDSAPICLQEIKQKKEEQVQEKQPLQNKNKRAKSLFHNFQKHLVITLKNIVKVNSSQQNGLVSKVASEMWSIFQQSHLYTKTILHILYGAQGQQQQCSFTSTMLNKFGYVDLFNKYSQDMIREAQEYLRKQTVKGIKKINLKNYLSRRRMAKSQQFEDYLNQFIEQLSQGPIKRRIPKTKKKNLKTYQKCINKQSNFKKQQQNSEGFKKQELF